MNIRVIQSLVWGAFGLGCSGAAGPAPATAAPRAPARETVVLLHGMGRSRLSMLILARRLRHAGYATVNFPYSPPFHSVEVISRRLIAFIEKKVHTPAYHLIAHSLGNVILRNGFRYGYPPGLGRIVMLAPPNRPARLAQALKKNPLYRGLTGESGQRLSDPVFYSKLPVPEVEFGVIAGDKGQRLTFSEPNDGVVAVAATRLPGMQDFLVLHHTHTFLMNAEDTFQACRRFLRTGRFKAPSPEGAAAPE